MYSGIGYAFKIMYYLRVLWVPIRSVLNLNFL